VGYSMGGLIATRALVGARLPGGAGRFRSLDDIVVQVVTLGTPFGGSGPISVACEIVPPMITGAQCRQFLAGAVFLRELAALRACPAAEVTTFGSFADLAVPPASSLAYGCASTRILFATLLAAGHALADVIGYAATVFDRLFAFPAPVFLRNLVWFNDGTAPDVPADVRRALERAVAALDLADIHRVEVYRDSIDPRRSVRGRPAAATSRLARADPFASLGDLGDALVGDAEEAAGVAAGDARLRRGRDGALHRTGGGSAGVLCFLLRPERLVDDGPDLRRRDDLQLHRDRVGGDVEEERDRVARHRLRLVEVPRLGEDAAQLGDLDRPPCAHPLCDHHVRRHRHHPCPSSSCSVCLIRSAVRSLMSMWRGMTTRVTPHIQISCVAPWRTSDHVRPRACAAARICRRRRLRFTRV